MIKKIAKIAVMAVAIGTVQLTGAAPAQAHPSGILCGFTSITDPNGEPGTQTGEVDGGPLVEADLDADPPTVDATASLTLKCTIQVGATGSTHLGPDSASASASASGVVVLGPTTISYSAAVGLDVFLCTQVTVNGEIHYYNSIDGEWSLDASVGCALAISQEVDPGPVGGELDPLLCPLLWELAPLFPPPPLGPLGAIIYMVRQDGPDYDGADVYINGELFWDCPPYEPES